MSVCTFCECNPCPIQEESNCKSLIQENIIICKWLRCPVCCAEYSSELKSCPFCEREKGEMVDESKLTFCVDCNTDFSLDEWAKSNGCPKCKKEEKKKKMTERYLFNATEQDREDLGHHGHPKFYELLDKMADLHSRKNHDYSGDDPLSNLKASEEVGIPAWKGILIRLMDKWGRLRQFAKTETLEVKDESVIDTLMDNAVYSLLCIILYEEYVEANYKEFKNE